MAVKTIASVKADFEDCAIPTGDDFTDLIDTLLASAQSQDLFYVVSADTGSVTAASVTDTLKLEGGTDISTTVSGKTVTIDYTGSGGGADDWSDQVTDTSSKMGGVTFSRHYIGFTKPVEAWGVFPDGHPSLSSAGANHAAMSAAMKSGEPLHMQVGTYSFNDGWDVSGDVLIQGAGCGTSAQATVLHITDLTKPAAFNIVGYQWQGCDFRDFRMVYTGSAAGAGGGVGHGIQCHFVEGDFHRLTIENFRGTGFKVNSTAGYSVGISMKQIECNDNGDAFHFVDKICNLDAIMLQSNGAISAGSSFGHGIIIELAASALDGLTLIEPLMNGVNGTAFKMLSGNNVKLYSGNFWGTREDFEVTGANVTNCHFDIGWVQGSGQSRFTYAADNTNAIVYKGSYNLGGVIARNDGSGLIGGTKLTANATNGFAYIPTITSAPGGTPVQGSGRSCIVFSSGCAAAFVYHHEGATWYKIGP